MNEKITSTRFYDSVDIVNDYSDILQNSISSKLNFSALNLILDM